MHRWIGIASCLLFVMWFFSGVVMMYVPFPSLTETARRLALPALDTSLVAVGPDAALARAGLARFPSRFSLEMLGSEPVYRIDRLVVSARDRERIDAIDIARATIVAARLAPASALTLLDLIERDQWTVTARYDGQRPFYRFEADDGAGTQIYVSRRTGEAALVTTRAERFWNWFGSIPHWIYPTLLRQDGALWRQAVLWISSIAMLSAFTGVYVGIHRLHWRRRYRGGQASPYRGWAAWHHWTGLVGGLALTTWIVSGWLSLDPGHVFRTTPLSTEQRLNYAGHEEASAGIDLGPLAALTTPTTRWIGFAWIGGAPVVSLLDDAGLRTSGLSSSRVANATARLFPDAALSIVSLDREDAYWYAHHRERVLPVMRAMFEDAARTWVHIDPRSGDILGSIDARGRLYRWLYNGLHSLDIGVLLRHRPAWDLIVGVLSAIGAVVSLSGTVIGWRRLRRRWP